ncbi:sulfide dehydrogenase [Acetobacter nitrogenifigens DSM 23921 = NBRC 105050]|uniref:Sulfurtransferase n=1 Tax=Acetobacter nitrogenifigens DSM 23921 = NBRC 105050 TaxID=1120919 RepID=A0A511XAF8_9PROT|nr:rhodanese-like domain-containing protein [Acetobacter nitrogenifigens]GBQ97497.1 sulfide dehydrogenase [Acetobacter nitrogenifigens DSM 23921 = NBRC 105050]GEN59891.1 sulfurtransferase [Acetobacter nitrogenifigens DSM 23921 = NBRC 105050]
MIDNISPEATWQAMQDQPEAQLIDVRTQAEWHFVGVPSVAALGRRLFAISWQLPNGRQNENFVDDLRDAGVAPDAPLYFICRSGARSYAAAAAAAAAGFGPVFNVADGFEGPLDNERHRGSVAGWKAAGLPWEQN